MRSFHSIDLHRVELEAANYRSMISEGAFLNAFQRNLLNLSVLISSLLPENPIAPSRNPLFLTRVVDLGPFVVFIGGSKVYFSLLIISVELVLKLTRAKLLVLL
jgi:hypothetical protein